MKTDLRKLAVAAALVVLSTCAGALPVAAGAAASPAPAAPAVALDAEEQATISLFDAASPSVVFVTTVTVHLDEVSLDPMAMPAGSGTGFVWDQRGHVVTNFHVVQGADALSVTLPDHTSWPATLVGAAPEKDLALLRIEAPAAALRPLPIGESHDLRVGQKVLAIGNPFGLDHTLTAGIVSALGREIASPIGIPIRDVVQTDAAINPGNSGGPLLDRHGRLVGVNAAVVSPSGAFAGIGFAIPAHAVGWVVPQLIAHGRIQRPSLGLELVPLSLAEALGIAGALVLRVDADGPAAKAGIVGVSRAADGRWIAGDLIESVDGRDIEGGVDLLFAIEERKAGEALNLGLLREGQRRTVEVTLAPWQGPAHLLSSHGGTTP
jgi:S1-C subfamily serine protease